MVTLAKWPPREAAPTTEPFERDPASCPDRQVHQERTSSQQFVDSSATGACGFSRLKEQLNTKEDLWSYVQDKIRFDYDPATCYLVSISNIPGRIGQLSAKVIDSKLFRNDDLSPIPPESALLLPLSAFADPDASLPPVAVISIPYTTLGSFLESAERDQEEMKGHSRCGRIQKLPPGTQLLKRQRTPE
ncbi:MAG: hypothetical protein M1840_007848 [Geoglossum simile]|nr:MAG: hypothetical protein M1840_007848 [Geoglossum simile]